MKLTNFTNTIRIQNSRDVIGSTRQLLREAARGAFVSDSASLLFHHVLNVVLLRAEKQMLRIDTGWIIAGVANVSAVGNSMFTKLKGYAVRVSVKRLAVLRDAELAIAARRFCSRPNPAVTGLVNLCPEPMLQPFALFGRHGRQGAFASYLRHLGSYRFSWSHRSPYDRPIKRNMTPSFADCNSMNLSAANAVNATQFAARNIFVCIPEPNLFYNLLSQYRRTLCFSACALMSGFCHTVYYNTKRAVTV